MPEITFIDDKIMPMFILKSIKSITLAIVLLNLIAGHPTAAQAEESDRGVAYARGLSSAFAKIAEEITPSVVNISAVKTRNVLKNNPSLQLNDPFLQPFFDFFGDDFTRQFGVPEGPAQQGLGTGVIIDKDGHIITNNHVIGEADEVRVRLHDGRSLKAEIIGTDPRSDLAVIKIKASNLKPAKMGDSDKLMIGEWVVAAGNPFGLDNTITTGIVSAKGRSISGGGQYEDYIQTDAAINPGNSGGPLVNLAGEVIGINTAIFSRSGGYMGIGFAIPSNMVRHVKESLIKEGKVIRGWLGVGIQNLTRELAESFNYNSIKGALIGQIEPNSPAMEAGFQPGDIIVSFDGVEVIDTNQLRNMVAAVRPGSSVKIAVIRDGRKKELSLSIGELPSASVPVIAGQQDSATELGLKVEALTTELARQLGTSITQGIVVTSVTPGSVAGRAGLQRGDIIISVDGMQISTVRKFLNILSGKNLKKGLRLLVESRGMQHFVLLKADE